MAAGCKRAPYARLLGETKKSNDDILRFLARTDVKKLKSILLPELAAHALHEREWFAKVLKHFPNIGD